jgi:hypothetical protein
MAKDFSYMEKDINIVKLLDYLLTSVEILNTLLAKKSITEEFHKTQYDSIVEVYDKFKALLEDSSQTNS